MPTWPNEWLAIGIDMGTLAVFAKWPEAGRVKTRLGFPPDISVQIADALLRDTLDRLTPLPYRRIVVTSPAEADFASLLPPGWETTPQGEGDLGERLTRFFARHLPSGESVVAVGTDSPTLPIEYVERAFEMLADADVVLGPACDGGYYLIGLRGELPPVFAGIDWSTPRVLGQTVARLSDPRWRVRLLPPWYDVDTAEDWQLLRGHVIAMLRAGVEPNLPRVEELLGQH